MEIIQAIKCKGCSMLMEPRDVVYVKELNIAEGSPAVSDSPGNITTLAVIRDVAFHNTDCFISWLRKEIKDEIPF